MMDFEQLEIVEGLTLEGLSVASDSITPYVLVCGSDDDPDGSAEAVALALMKRPGGVLLAVPPSFFPEEMLQLGNQGEEEAVFGPSITVEVPGVVVDGGSVSRTGTSLEVVIIDCSAAVVDQLRLLEGGEVALHHFDEDDPLALPSVDALVLKATDWISSASAGRVAFYSAEGGDTPVQTPKASKQKRKPGGQAIPTGDGSVKPKRVTTASLAESVGTLLQTLPVLNAQMTALTQRQSEMEQMLGKPLEDKQVVETRSFVVPTSKATTSRPMLSQPLGGSLDLPPASMTSLSTSLAPPPRTHNRPQSGILESSLVQKPSQLQELEEEKPLLDGKGDALAQAVLAQSQALTALVGQIATASGDPLTDLSQLGAGVGSRGATTRAKLQSELASHRAVFYTSVMQQMSRRMLPMQPVDVTPSVMLDRGVCGTRYLERFGGYGRHRELGQIQYQVMMILDYLTIDNINAAKDCTALLAVMLEQMVMDNGRLEVASLLSLQEDPPIGVFTNRQLLATSKAKSFAPLADQRWITSALAYLKEMDVIAAKRVEFSAAIRPSGSGGDPGADVAPKPKAKHRPRARGRGRGGQGDPALEEA